MYKNIHSLFLFYSSNAIKASFQKLLDILYVGAKADLQSTKDILSWFSSNFLIAILIFTIWISETQNIRYSDPQKYFFFRADKVVNDDDYDKKRSKAAIRAQALKEMQNEKEVSHYIG